MAGTTPSQIRHPARGTAIAINFQLFRTVFEPRALPWVRVNLKVDASGAPYLVNGKLRQGWKPGVL
jgi:hypothetical protein